MARAGQLRDGQGSDARVTLGSAWVTQKALGVRKTGSVGDRA